MNCFETVASEHGARVTAHYRSSSVAITQLTAEPGINRHSDRLRTAQADLSHEEQVRSLFSCSTGKAEAEWGEVEIAVINHGVFLSADVPLKDMSTAQWERTISDNLTSSFLVAREYLRGLERGVRAASSPDNKTDTGGLVREFGERAAIVFIGSTAGKCGEAMHADYAASKSGAYFRSPLMSTPTVTTGGPEKRSCTASRSRSRMRSWRLHLARGSTASRRDGYARQWPLRRSRTRKRFIAHLPRTPSGTELWQISF